MFTRFFILEFGNQETRGVMKKKYCIGWLLAGAAAMFLITHSAASAANKVVVIPLGGDSGGVSTVTSAGQVWMDRNLGALGVATKSDDPDAYGSLYQWGRLGDGHEYRASPTTLTKSPTYVPGHGNFITGSSSPHDWLVPKNDNLWQGESGINNPCPAGFRLPTATELDAERASWGSNDPAGAFASPLKLVVAGVRMHATGFISGKGSSGYYWSSTAISGSYSARRLVFTSGLSLIGSGYRAYGFSVRCLKD